MLRSFKLSGAGLVAYAAVASFATYFCMYAFRKPFAAGTYEGDFFGGVELKTAFVIAQILGYTISKYLGVKICSEVKGTRKGAFLVIFILIAEAALLLFGLLPGRWKILAIFANGLPLGMVWGIVVKFLEGRRTSDFLLACLCCSFVLASGVVKDIGRWLMAEHNVVEVWMPALTGALFLPIFIVAVFALSLIPPPDDADKAARTERFPMEKKERHAFFRKYLPGLIAILVFFFFITAFRDFRDVYEVEIFADLGFSNKEEGLLSKVALIAAFGSLTGLAAINFIQDNRKALLAAFVLMIVGMVVLGISTVIHSAGMIGGFTWMALSAVGAYLAYVPLNAILFERLMAATHSAGTAVFAMQLSDAVGYTGPVLVQIYKDVGQGSQTRLQFFESFTYIMSLVGICLLLFAILYFLRNTKKSNI